MRGSKTKPPADWIPPTGFCECGCGEQTKICTATRPEFDQYNGFPQRYAHGHNPRGKRAGNWKGGRVRDVHGYWWLYRPDHPRTTINGYVREHRIVWEEANGRLLRPDEDVHHIDGDRGNNALENLVALTKKQHRAAHHADPEWAAQFSDMLRERYKDPVARAKTSEAIKNVWRKRKNEHA